MTDTGNNKTSEDLPPSDSPNGKLKDTISGSRSADAAGDAAGGNKKNTNGTPGGILGNPRHSR